MANSKVGLTTNAITGTLPVANGGTGSTTLAGAGLQRPNVNPYIINGNFGVWQRGTSFTTSVYTADRWLQDLSGASATLTREAHTVGQTDVPDNPKYYLKQNVTTGNDNCGMLYRIEDVDILTGAFTLSFYAKGVNPNSGNLDIIIQQNFGSGGSGTISLSEQDLTLTGSWQKFVFTGTLASISGKTIGTSSYIQIIIKQPSDDANTAAWNLQISQVQLESGTYTSATIPPFQSETYQANFLRCARYYTEYGGAADASFTANYDLLCEANGTAAFANATFWTPVPLRAVPSINNPTMVYFDYDTSTANTSGGTVAVLGGGERMSCVSISGSGAANLTDAKITGCRVVSVLTMDAEL
tara:strand:- start:235 stop:1302 length:1068 start_codon:yes stop_codon:yes gene_type:complete